MYKLKNLLKTGGHELAQVVKRVKERDSWVQPERRELDVVKLSFNHSCGPVVGCGDCVKQYMEAVFLGKKLRVNSNNDVVYTSRGYCCISNIVQEGEHVFVIGRFYLQCVDVFTVPCKSKLLGIAKCRELECVYRKIHVRDVTKCVKVMGEEWLYVSILLHDNV